MFLCLPKSYRTIVSIAVFAIYWKAQLKEKEGTKKKKRGYERAEGTNFLRPTRILKEGGTFLFFRRGLFVVPRSSEQFSMNRVLFLVHDKLVIIYIRSCNTSLSM